MRFLFLAVLLPLFLPAQSINLKDPDIVWAIEIEQDWVIDTPSLATEWDQGLTTLKMVRNKQHWVVDVVTIQREFDPKRWDSPIIPLHTQYKASDLSSTNLADLVYEAVLQKKLPVFKDANCRIPFDIISQLDTIITFDPTTQKESIKVIYNMIDPVAQFKAWRLKQVLAYHKKSATWTSTIEAIAPLISVNYHYRPGDSLVPFFWFRPENKAKNLSSDHITWAKRTLNKQPKTQVPVNTKTLKTTPGFENPLVDLFQLLQNSPKALFYDGWNDQPLSIAERRSMLVKIDTTVNFDPETYEEVRKISRREITADSIHQLRLMQTWYWDDDRHRLSIHLEGVAPLVDVFNYWGDLIFYKPLFYRRGKR